MSNLYKPWYITTKDTRVIDSDAFAGEIIKKSIKTMPKGRKVDADGFSAGLIAEDGSNIIEPEEEIDYVAKAREEAEEILAEARREAEEITAQAKAQRDDVLNAAKEEGYQDGKQRLEQELEQKVEQLEAEFSEKEKSLEADYITKRDNMEHDLVDVILQVFDRVFQIQFEDKKELLISIINNAISNIEGEKNFRIRVSEDNVLFVENHKESILDRVGHDIGLEIVPDASLSGSGCVIETDSGVFECSLGVQLESLIKDIRSLSS